MSALFAATYPQRAWALILFGSFPRVRWAPDYPFGEREEESRQELEETLRLWTDPNEMLAFADALIPGADDRTRRALATAVRQSASPSAVEALHRMNLEIDVRHVLPAISIPTLVMVRAGDHPMNVNGSRYLAEHISGARYVELPGTAHAAMGGDPEPVLEEVERFLREAWESAAWEEEPDRVLATVLFTDIVGSTAKAAELGDARWRELLGQHHALIRRQLVRFRGRELDTAGDGFFAAFDGPARAIRCARAISESMAELGLEVRAGLHTGECERLDGKVAGIAVSIGARVAAQARRGEVLVSQTVKDLVAGSGISFVDRGTAELKGVPGEWRLFAVEGV
jgi:class 3 adenylate cyclase